MMLLNAWGKKYNNRETERVYDEYELLLRRPSIAQLGMQFWSSRRMTLALGTGCLSHSKSKAAQC